MSLHNRTIGKENKGRGILVLGCFDTKGADFQYLRQCILAYCEDVITMNTGIFGTTTRFPVDVEADEVALAAGSTLRELGAIGDRGHAVDIMGQGAAVIASRLLQEGKVKAVVGMGGGGGTYIALAAMQRIPFGIPKLCLSTVATKDLSHQVGSKDIALFPSVVDVGGLNSMSRVTIGHAAAAICGMAKRVDDADSFNGWGDTERIAISMFGNTTACVTECTTLLKAKGYEVFSFHANGVGGRTMESLIEEGFFAGVLDITTTELADHLCGGICSAGPGRLTAAAVMGIPQVVVPGCLDMVNFAQLDSVPSRYVGRQLYNWAPDVTLMRTNEEENRILGEHLVRKVNASPVGATILLPLRGLSQLDSEGGVFFRPDINQVLFDSIRSAAEAGTKVVEADFHINDKEFAQLTVVALVEMIERNSELKQ